MNFGPKPVTFPWSGSGQGDDQARRPSCSEIWKWGGRGVPAAELRMRSQAALHWYFLHLTQSFFRGRADMGGDIYTKKQQPQICLDWMKNHSFRTTPPPLKKKKGGVCIFDSGKLVRHTALNTLFPWRNLPLRAVKLWQNFTSPYRVWQVVNNASMLLLCIVQLGSAHDAEWKGGGRERERKRERREQQEYSCILLQKAIYIFSWALSLSLFLFRRFPNESSVSQFP